MKNSKLVNVVLVVIIGLSLLFVAKDSLAVTDLTNTLTGNNTATNNSSNIQTITGNETTLNNTTNNTVNNKTNSTVLTTNNTSSYNNTSLPKTGVGDAIPGVILAVVLGISAVYAYNKINYYKNI